ncbi:acyltransferase family protein [Microbacterium marinilacus]|uniref:Acyltransferase n=1 Tax=Microbacterium marinilacus TaxID=415209 RepID=A0ABP7BM58_9MICO|nr:acyltransferase [Microbacterium marinilacus]MBY0690051.1 acyltransferase [Microbacterium marinilacus]
MTTEAPVRTRETWADTAKGIAIILVVLLHAEFDYLEVLPKWRWDEYSGVIETFRMPLFFFTAGLFAQRALAKDLRGLIDSRLLRLVWVYTLWTAVGLLVAQAIPFVARTGLPLWESLLLLPVWPNAATWFVYAIVLYFVLAWLLRRLPMLVQLLLAVGVTVLFHTGRLLPPMTEEWVKIGEYFLFFLLAVAIGPRLRALAPRVRAWQALVAPMVYAGLVAALRVAGAPQNVVVWLSMSLLAVPAGCGLAIALSQARAFGWLARLGSDTLRVYLLHWYVLTLATFLLGLVPVWPSALVPLLVPALVAAAFAGSLVVHRLVRHVPGLFDRPSWFRLPQPRPAPPGGALPQAGDLGRATP